MVLNSNKLNAVDAILRKFEDTREGGTIREGILLTGYLGKNGYKSPFDYSSLFQALAAKDL